jgi:hypothetical protein
MHNEITGWLSKDPINSITNLNPVQNPEIGRQYPNFQWIEEMAATGLTELLDFRLPHYTNRTNDGRHTGRMKADKEEMKAGKRTNREETKKE